MDLGHDYTIYPIQNDLTSNGVQNSTVVTTTTANTDVTLFSYSFDLNFGNLSHYHSDQVLELLWIYFDINIDLKADASATADLKWKAQARDEDGTWVDLFAYQTVTDIGMHGVSKINRCRSIR